MRKSWSVSDKMNNCICDIQLDLFARSTSIAIRYRVWHLLLNQKKTCNDRDRTSSYTSLIRTKCLTWTGTIVVCFARGTVPRSCGNTRTPTLSGTVMSASLRPCIITWRVMLCRIPMMTMWLWRLWMRTTTCQLIFVSICIIKNSRTLSGSGSVSTYFLTRVMTKMRCTGSWMSLTITQKRFTRRSSGVRKKNVLSTPVRDFRLFINQQDVTQRVRMLQERPSSRVSRWRRGWNTHFHVGLRRLWRVRRWVHNTIHVPIHGWVCSGEHFKGWTVWHSGW